MVFACAKGDESQKGAGDLKVVLSIARYPLIMDNSLTVIADAAGKATTDAGKPTAMATFNIDARQFCALY